MIDNVYLRLHQESKYSKEMYAPRNLYSHPNQSMLPSEVFNDLAELTKAE